MDDSRSLSRRHFVAATGASLAGLAIAADAEAQQPQSQQSPAAGRAKATPAFRVLSVAEARDLDAITSRMLPSEPSSPGARELGVVACADRQLARPGFGTDATKAWREGRAELTRLVGERHPGVASFAALAPAQQDAILTDCSTADPSTAPNDDARARLRARRAVFEISLRLTQIGAFADPMYGGNRQKQGWRLLGFDDRHSWTSPFGEADRG